jgi:ATP-dependent Clp protease ATP-binding subunit ClpA
VTVTPLEHPELAVHAESVDDALLDLSLALDDRIRRAHPRHLWRFAGSGEGQSGKLSSPGLRVWHGTSSSAVDVSLVTWQRPALQRMREVYLPTLGLRFWLQEQEEEGPVLGPVLKETLEKMPDTEVLRLALGGRAEFQVLTVESQPVQLAALKPDELHLDARPFRSREELAELAAEEDARQRRQRARADEKKRQERARRQTPTLKLLGVPLHTRAARARLEPVWERDAEVERLLAHIERERPQPLVLVAPHGSGKTALLEAMARKMGEPGGSRARRTRPVFLLDGSRLIAGTGGFGEWQRQLQESVEEARRSGAVLVLGRLVDLLDAGKSAHSDNNAAQVLAPVLASREVTVLAEATPEDWATVQRRNASFAGVWAPWRVEELGPEAVRRVLRQAALRLGERHRIVVHEEAEEEALALCRRFWPYGSLVGNVVTFLRRLVAARSHERAEAVRRLDVIEFFSVEAGIPASLLRDDVPLEPEEVRSFLGARVMAQPHAVERAVRVITMLKASLQDPRKPAAVLLFAGPTGVGKTELAKAIAELVFGSKERMIRVDMGEYLGPDALTRLLGDGDGDGLLPAQVRRQPFCVLLLDELEKAHPVVFDALLGVLGEGRLSDAAGRLADARQAVLIMTSNLGVKEAASQVGFAASVDGARTHCISSAQRFFRPEFFNRIDRLVPFRSLDPEALRHVFEQQFAELLGRRGIARANLLVEVEPAMLDALVTRAYDPRFGARPLKRAIKQRVVAPLAWRLASAGERPPSAIHLDVARGEVSLRETPALPPAPAPAPQPPSTSSASGHSLAPRGDPGHWV